MAWRSVSEVVLDTHALVWFLEGNSRLSSAARAAIEAPGQKLILPVIAFAEAMWVVDQGRTGIPDVEHLVRDVAADSRISVAALTTEVAVLAQTLSAIPEMHDRQVVATALAQQPQPVAVVTKDEAIRDSGLVEVIW
jgi:PIN domain nuclease of toxin-antitoxin system